MKFLCLMLTSCCAALFLTGHRLVPHRWPRGWGPLIQGKSIEKRSEDGVCAHPNVVRKRIQQRRLRVASGVTRRDRDKQLVVSEHQVRKVSRKRNWSTFP